MITIRLEGRLGNQLHQYAFARALSERTGAKLMIDGVHNKTAGHGGYLMGDYDISAKVSRRPTWPRWIREDWAREQRVAKVWYRARRVVLPRTHAFDAAAFDAAGDHTYFAGGWMSERYFADIREILEREFTPRSISEPVLELARQIDAEPAAVGVHVRRGDMADDPVASVTHGVCAPEYFSAAIALVRERVPNARFHVFSDDPQWCAENLDLDFDADADADAVMVSGTTTAPEDLYLMSRCRHFVTSNSSFSWWGAWLGEQEDSVVVAPDRYMSAWWFDDSEIAPERWIRLPRTMPPPGPVELVDRPAASAASHLRDSSPAAVREEVAGIAAYTAHELADGFLYYRQADDEEWKRGFWDNGTVFRRMFDQMDLEIVLEIGAGTGRHANVILERSRQIFVQDTSPAALALAEDRFSQYRHVNVLPPGDGFTLDRIPDASLTAIFSFDSMHSFAPASVEAYVAEAARTLRPGGMMLAHYSALPAAAETPPPGYRNFLGSEAFAAFASEYGLEIADHAVIDWTEPQSDAITLLRRPAE